MKTVSGFHRHIPCFLLAGLLAFPALSRGAAMQDYCVVPPFVGQNVPANLLLMIDNSSSMYDLTYSDQGYTSGSTTYRQPYYCYDETYQSTNTYAGYFNSSKYYVFDFTNKYFATGSYDATQCTSSLTIANTLCIGINSSNKVSYFAASGNYLNWLSASKFDVEKGILTGGKVVSNLCSGTDQSCNTGNDCGGVSCTAVTAPFIQGESRGCVGQGFVKAALTGDFVNFTTTDPNTKLGVTFLVRGPVDQANASNPSRGGQTYIEIYTGTYNNQACQTAVSDYYDPTVNQSTLQNAIQACINYTSSTSKATCYGAPTMACTTDSDCYKGTPGTCATVGGSCNTSTDCPTYISVSGTCSNTNNSGGAISCTSDANCAAGSISGGTCSNNSSVSCTQDSQCGVKTSGKCSVKYKGAFPACNSDSDCTIGGKSYGTCSNPLPQYYSCSAQNPSTSGTCTNPKPTNANYACNGVATTYVGPCSSQSGAVNTKIALSQTIQTCWTYLSRGQAIGTGDYTRLIGGNGKCDTVYASYGGCSGDLTHGCSSDTDCSASSLGTCTFGPAGIVPGNPAYVCSNDYLGHFCSWNATTKTCTWDTSNPTAIETAYANFCNAQQPTVIDPTDSAASSTNYEQLPALIGGMGVTGQLGNPIGTIPVRKKISSSACSTNLDCATGYACLNSVCTPSGLIQQFGSQIRIGALSFNFNGSATEASATAGAAIPMPRVCSNNTTRQCSIDTDCPNGYCLSQANSAAYNLDGGQVLYPIGLGTCATMTGATCATSATCSTGQSCINGFCGTMNSTVCTTDANCASGDTCISNGAGDHTSGLVNTIDSIRANAWTPFAEAFYSAIGYFARTSSGTSRTDLMLNQINTSGTNFTSYATVPKDFNPNLNPSQYKCQQNAVLLITDGSSTADQNASVASLASTYSASALAGAGYTSPPSGWDSTCPDYAGSSYLPILSWLAYNRNIANFTTTPQNTRDRISTYVVTTGGSNGLSGECNALNMLTDTAVNGGTQQLYQANDPTSLNSSLMSIFQQLAATSASGTAASILSNSAGSGANILQAIFFPRKVFDNQTQANWIGEMNNLWYYIDPYIGNSSMREDTNGDYSLELTQDYVVQFIFDPLAGVTKVNLLQDTDGNGSGDTLVVQGESPDLLKSLWKAGKQLWARDLTLSPRSIYTPCVGTGTCNSGTAGLMKFSWSSPDNSAALQTNLQAPDNATAVKLMQYVHGFDFPGDTTMRSRTVQSSFNGVALPSDNLTDAAYITNPQDKGIGVWKLGDIISSTPRTQSSGRLNAYNLPPPGGYSDVSYGNDSSQKGFIYTTSSYTASDGRTIPAYANRGMVYVGANDGMLHAFNLGTLQVLDQGDTKASLAGTGLGNEAWAFMPQNVLPYLTYYANPNYSHLYFMDGSTKVVDASIGACSGATNYWDCPKDTTSGNGTNWRTILVGGMGQGGASRNYNDTCQDGVGGTCVKTPLDGVGYSSYYALDVTDPNKPQYLWEFSDAVLPSADKGLGFATSGAAVVRISARNASNVPDKTKNGRWFAVFGSGPTGPIDKSAKHRFMGTSNQPLKVYVVDLNATPPFVNGTNYWVISDVYDGGTSTSATVSSATKTSLPNAFAGSLVNGNVDVDKWNSTAPGFYQDDAVYFGYTQMTGTAGPWTSGGVVKLVTFEDPNPANWRLVKVFDGIGPVTAAISRIQDPKNHHLWLYFGTGRYYYLQDDFVPARQIFGIKDACYTLNDTLDPTCAVKHTSGDEINETTVTSSTNDVGWSITLRPESTSDPTNILGGERLLSDPSALTNGAVYFTTYKPNYDFCQYGGRTYMWAVKYDTGTQAPTTSLKGKAIVQVSTGEFIQIDLSSAFTDMGNRAMADPGMTGKSSNDASVFITNSNNKPVKRIIHMQEH